MISIIISSGSQDLLRNVKKSIENTIGVPYEIISFDNRKGEYGICELYNQGVAQAKFNLLCFMHEDVEIKTSNWGAIVSNHFEQCTRLGLIGLAGSKYKSAVPLGWDSASPRSNYLNIIQGYKYIDKDPVHEYYNPENFEITEVACVDGVWFCCPKHVAQQFPFDDQRLTGFHGYDIDFSLAVGQDYKVAVTFKVLLAHFSEGQYSSKWFRDIYYVHRKWRHLLPINLSELKGKELSGVELNSFKHVVKLYGHQLSILEAIDILTASYIPRASFTKYIKLLCWVLFFYSKNNKLKGW